MDDREAPSGAQQSLDRYRLRIRTVSVSFAAAVSSAHRDLETSSLERDALVEVWRAWSVETLERYRAELLEGAHEPDAELEVILGQLEAAIESVRHL